ncbi:MAG: SET domain-containing protein-lysine N-methyltransferase [Gammaproteobacteria bacterium]|nr:SET domain-containing protein-lysine N-methyltransferase [Gammaproteobacteria bacterium]
MNTIPTTDLPVVIKRVAKKGRGIFARQDFESDEIVIIGTPVVTSVERTWQTLQIDVDTHVRVDEPFELVNHSCDPNCGVRANEVGGYDLVARRKIYTGDEINFDYAMTEWISIAVSDCHCGTDLCRGKILGGKYLSPEFLKKYEGFLTPYYSKLLMTEVNDSSHILHEK